MKKTLLARFAGWILTIAVASSAAAQQVSQSWQFRYDGPAGLQDSANTVATDATGNLYVGGQTFLGSDGDMWIAKYGPNGALQWSTTYAGTSVDDDNCTAIVVDSAGNVYAAGNSAGAIALLKYSPGGALQWVQRFQDGFWGWSSLAGMVIDGSGNIVLAGTTTTSTSSPTDVIVLKYSSSGVLQWSSRYLTTGGLNESASAIGVDGIGNVYVTGTAYGGATDYDMLLLKFSPTGTRLWERKYDGPGGWDEGVAIAVDAAGNAVVAGFSQWFWATVRWNTNGAQQWVALEPAGSWDVSPTGVALDAAGNVIVSGYQDVGREAYAYDFGVVKYSSAGAKQWAYSYDGPDSAIDVPTALAIDGNGNAYVVGYSTTDLQFTRADSVLIRLSPGGHEDWVQRYNPSGSGLALPAGVALNAVGAISIVGSTLYEDGYSDDVFAVRYEQSEAFSLDVSPTSVVGGRAAVGTVMLSAPAPSAGISITLRSSNTNAATVPASVNVLAGRTSANFSITTRSVTADTDVVITATNAGTNATSTLQVRRQLLSAVSVAPTSIVGGNEATGTVLLSGPAPSGGFPVTLTDSHARVTVPAQVVVPEGATSAQFPVETQEVTADVNVTITAANSGTNKTATLTVKRPILKSITVPTDVPKNSQVTCRVNLNYAAPTGGLSVVLESSNPAATVPASVFIPATRTFVDFFIQTGEVQADASVTITASAAGTTRNANMTIRAEMLTSVTLSVPTAIGGNNVTGTVRLFMPAPTGGLLVNLASDSPSATMPASVTVPAGQLATNFLIQTGGVAESTPVVISAQAGGTPRTASLTLLPATLSTFTMTPTTIVAGSAGTGVVTLNGKAPADGTLVTIESSDPSKITPPETVLVPGGSTSVTFQAPSDLAATGAARVTVRSGGFSRYVDLRFVTVSISSFTLSTNLVAGGTSLSATVRLSINAPTGGLYVDVVSNNAYAIVPSRVLIPAGRNYASFAIRTTRPPALQSAQITASIGASVRTVSFNIRR
jgi:hypothetical protein